jgi:hypothetical protein
MERTLEGADLWECVSYRQAEGCHDRWRHPPARVPYLDPLLPPKILLSEAEALLDGWRR